MIMVSKYVIPKEVALNGRDKGQRRNWTDKGEVTLQIFPNLEI